MSSKESYLPELGKIPPKRAPLLKLSNLLSLPNRVVNLPNLSRKSFSGAEGSAPKIEKPKLEFGKVRTWGRSAIAEVKLEDILSGQHAPPLTLSEFEDYLLHVERTPENLSFHFWLQDYTKRYRKWELSRIESDVNALVGSENIEKDGTCEVSESYCVHAGIRKTELPPELSESLEKAMLSFLYGPPSQGLPPTPGLRSDLELNLPAEVKEQIKLDCTLGGDPIIFSMVNKEVKNMLEESMRRWLIIISGNADQLRSRARW